RQSPRALRIGQRTGGSSARPVGHELPNGVVAYLPSWVDLGPDGVALEGVGIAPDVEILGDFASEDPILEEALRAAESAAAAAPATAGDGAHLRTLPSDGRAAASRVPGGTEHD